MIIMTGQRCYCCGRTAAEYMDYVNNNCYLDIHVRVMDPDFEISLNVFNERRYRIEDGDPEIIQLRNQRRMYDKTNGESLKKSPEMKGWRSEYNSNMDLYIPDSFPRFNRINSNYPKMTKSQFDALKKDVDAYKRNDVAALYASKDPVFFPMGYMYLGDIGDWDWDKYNSAKSLGFPLKPEQKELLEKHFRVYRSSPNAVKYFRNYQMRFEIQVYEEAIKRIEKIFEDETAKRSTTVDSLNKQEQERKMKALEKLKTAPFMEQAVGEFGIVKVSVCPICQSLRGYDTYMDD